MFVTATREPPNVSRSAARCFNVARARSTHSNAEHGTLRHSEESHLRESGGVTPSVVRKFGGKFGGSHLRSLPNDYQTLRLIGGFFSAKAAIIAIQRGSHLRSFGQRPSNATLNRGLLREGGNYGGGLGLDQSSSLPRATFYYRRDRVRAHVRLLRHGRRKSALFSREARPVPGRVAREEWCFQRTPSRIA
jgi:hypothetical protein